MIFFGKYISNMVIFRPSIPLSPQQQGRLQLLGYPPEVVDGTKFDVYGDSSAPCGTPRCVCACIDVLYCPSCPSYGYNEGLSRLSLASIIAQPALELGASLAAGLGVSRPETGFTIGPPSNSLPYPKPLDLRAEIQAQSGQSSETSRPSEGIRCPVKSILRGGLLDDNTKTPVTNEKTKSQDKDGAVSTKIRRPSLQGNTWLLANRTEGSKNGGLNSLANLSLSEQANLARFTPPDTPSPEENKAVLHRPLVSSTPNDSACHHDNEGQHAQLPSQHDDSRCSAFDPPINRREGDAQKQRCEDPEMPPNSPFTPDDIMRIASNNFNKAQEDNNFEAPNKLDKGKGRAMDPWTNNMIRQPNSPVSTQDIHLDAAETLSSLGQARKSDKGKGKAIGPPLGTFTPRRSYYQLQSQFNDLTEAQRSPHLEETRKMDKGKGKGKAIDHLWSGAMRPPPSPTPEHALPWNNPILFSRGEDFISQGSPSSPRPGFRSLPPQKPLPPTFSSGTSVSGNELYHSIEGRGSNKAEPSNLPSTPRPTPRLRFKPLPAAGASPLAQDKDDALEAFNRKTPAFDPPACFFSDSDTDSEEGVEIPYTRKQPQDRMEFLAETIRDHFALPNVPDTKRAYDFPEPERTRRLLRFDREVATPYITEHRSVQTSTYEEEENEAPYLQAACGGMINLNKSGDLLDEHRFRWRNGFDRMEKLGKEMTVWSHRGYGAPRSYMEHDKLAHAEMKKRRDERERMVRAGKVFRRAKRAGLCVDREGFVVPSKKEARRVPPGMDLSPSGEDAWETDFMRQREMMRWAEKVAAGASGATGSHDQMLPSVEEAEEHDSDGSGDCESDVDEHPELDDLRLASGLAVRQYLTKRLSPFGPMDNVRLRNRVPDDAKEDHSAMVFPGFALKEPMINSHLSSASSSPDDPNPKPSATFCPSWHPRHFSSFVQKHAKENAQLPKIVITTPTPEPTDDEWDSEDDEGWAEEEYLQCKGLAGTFYPGWDEPMLNGRLRSRQPQDPQPAGTFCPSWDPRHYEHFVEMQGRRGKEGPGEVPKVVVTMPSPEAGEDGDGWDSEDGWEEGEWDEESREDWVGEDDLP